MLLDETRFLPDHVEGLYYQLVCLHYPTVIIDSLRLTFWMNFIFQAAPSITYMLTTL